MTHRTTIFPLLIYLLFTWGCITTINKQYLSPVELEKVQAVKVFMEEKNLNGRSYKFIQKVQGYSGGKFLAFSKEPHKYEAVEQFKHEAVEQLKIYAVRAGGNAIANIACIFEIDRVWFRGEYMTCVADAILLDKYGQFGNPIKDDENIPKAKVEEDCDPGMESCI